MSGSIGPVLPPGYSRRSSSPGSGSDQEGASSRADKTTGPALPSQDQRSEPRTSGTYGPVLPPGFATTTSSTSRTPPDSSYGPLLPPGLSRDEGSKDTPTPPQQRSLGPSLPPGYKREETQDSDREEEEESKSHGPLPPKREEEDDDDVIGPMPVVGGAKEGVDRIKKDIESRSRYMKDKLLGKDTDSEQASPRREEWMTELPPEFKPLGVGPRKFRTTANDAGDRSVWTDTPADRLRKQMEGQKKETKVKQGDEEVQVSKREREIAEHVESYNKKYRSQSLMDMHRKRRAEEIGKEGATERRPFNRETDLEAPRSLVTPAKRRALVQDSRTALGNKFSRGSKSFL